MTTDEIIEAMQFSLVSDRVMFTTTGRYTLTYQYEGYAEPVYYPSSSTFTGWTPLSTAERAAFEAQLAHIETFLNVDFVEVTGSSDPDINVGKVTIPGNTIGYGGLSVRYTYGSGGQPDTITSVDSFVVYDNTLDISADSRVSLILHELGHALGMKHPFSAPALPTDQDTNKYTLMSYTVNPDTGTDADAMMIYDILALQDLWGAADYNEGNTTYSGGRADTIDVIWDSGGKDTIDASGQSSGVRIDLNEGAFSNLSGRDDMAIAYGTVIENATGGSGDDVIAGNAFINKLRGNNGNDSIDGGGRKDSIWGGVGKDVLSGGAADDRLWGGSGRDRLRGDNGDDLLRGGGARDRIEGGRGDDMMYGNAGNDVFIYRSGHGADVIADFSAGSDAVRFFRLGDTASVLSAASDVNGDVLFDFGGGNSLTVQGVTLAQITDDILA